MGAELRWIRSTNGCCLAREVFSFPRDTPHLNKIKLIYDGCLLRKFPPATDKELMSVSKSASMCAQILRGCALLLVMAAAVLLLSPTPGYAAKGGVRSDMDRDGDVDLDDLALFAEKLHIPNWETFDWCGWLQTQTDSSLQEMYDFIDSYYQCQTSGGSPLPVQHRNDYPTRLALGPGGKVYVSNRRTGSVFIYDAGIKLSGELAGLDKPMGVAVDAMGNIFVGSKGKQRVEVYDLAGLYLRSVGEGIVKAPNDLAFDRDGTLYVLDGESFKVWVFAPDGTPLGSIGFWGGGPGRFKAPVSLLIYYAPNGLGGEVGEVYVADAGQGFVHVFDLLGNYLRHYGGKPSGFMTYNAEGQPGFLRAIQMDVDGRLHVLDSQMNNIQIWDRTTVYPGNPYITEYGTPGAALGQIDMPFDILIDSNGMMVIANFGNKRLDQIVMP